MIPMIIEAPLNTVLKAIFKPDQPFKLYEARHVSRGPATVSRMPGDLDEAQRLDEAGTFGEGSMGPKVRAAIDFVRRTGGRAIITELSRGRDAVRGGAGTTIVAEDA
jgi:hypothetical protein